MFADGFDHAGHPIGNRSETAIFECEGVGGETKGCCSTHIGGESSGTNKGLGGDTTCKEAVTTQRSLFNESHAGTQLRRTARNHQTGRATAYDDEVVIIHEPHSYTKVAISSRGFLVIAGTFAPVAGYPTTRIKNGRSCLGRSRILF